MGVGWLPRTLDIQEMTDSVAKHGTSYAHGDGVDSIVRVPRLHVGII